MEAIILAGGFGTRLKKLNLDVPKPMIPLGKHPFLFYLLSWLKKNGITRVILSVGYKWEIIEEYFGTSFRDIELVYSVEDEPLGTGGAIKKALEYCNEELVWVINGDTFFEIDLKSMQSFHIEDRNYFTLAAKPVKDTSRYGRVLVDEQARITGFGEKAEKGPGLINGGIYLFEKGFFKDKLSGQKFSFEKDILEKYVLEEKFGAFVSERYFIDIGTPEDYRKAQMAKDIFGRYKTSVPSQIIKKRD
ncbi:MAG: D-glycero-D-manno-heptose 1-phosphate guanosyltransferase [Bacteroidetes bacterium]|nr:MAG: D-glycero-D-manno-heptose 1-phosphate guanosyltransferase [Bacteroidota bacterium]